MSELVPGDAVRAIQESVKTEVIEVGLTPYVTRPVFEPPRDPLPATVKLNTLTGLIDYVNRGADGVTEDENGLMVHVVSERQVDVVSGLFGRAEQRKIYVTATAEAVLSASQFRYGEFYNCEEFNIKIQSLFETHEGNDNKAVVLRVVGNIKEENVRTTGDDGVTQSVTARSGIARVEEVQVPNPVYLAPFRTFREVTQPLSPFVLRMKQGGNGNLPTVALFEADGGKWKLDAIRFVKEFLEDQIGTVPIIA